MVLNVRDAKLADEAGDLVWRTKCDIEKHEKKCAMTRGAVVNRLLLQLAEIEKKFPDVFDQTRSYVINENE